MKIAVLADLHDNLTAWNIVNKQLKKHGADALIICGDLCSADVLKIISKDFKGLIYLVDGNVADRKENKATAAKLANVTHFEDLGEIELDNKKIAFVHHPRKVKELIINKNYDYVFFGHTHQQSQEKVGNTIVVNPGTAGGMFQYPSYAVVDLIKAQVEFKQIILK